MNLLLPVSNYFDLNIGLLQAPYYAPDLSYFILGLSGEIRDRANPNAKCPLSPAKYGFIYFFLFLLVGCLAA